MKKIILVFFFLVIVLRSNSQISLITSYPVSIDSTTNLISYHGVVEVKGVKAEELYNRIYKWFNTYYKNPVDVIRDSDSIKCIVVGKPRFRLLEQKEKDGPKVEGNSIVQYTITVAARDGRFKYELTIFNWKQISYYACEKWMDTKAIAYQPIYNDYLQQLETYSLETISSLKNMVTREKSSKDKDDW